MKAMLPGTQGRIKLAVAKECAADKMRQELKRIGVDVKEWEKEIKL